MAEHGGIWPVPLDGRVWGWLMVGDYLHEIGKPGSGHWLVVRDGFTSDLVTKPKSKVLAWLVDANDPQTARAAIVHDAMLAQGFEQRVAAGEFYRVLVEDGVAIWKAKLFFAAVLIGSDNWENAAPLSAAPHI
jgi:hypothetical protein